MIRRPQVAGQFYPGSPAGLKSALAKLIDLEKPRPAAWGIVSPHAGYVFSGKVAGLCFSQTKITKTVIILGPNHTGLGEPFSIFGEGTWKMPLGKVEVDSSLARRIREKSRHLKDDIQAHLYEHSIEVQIPFLQYLLPEVKIVPVVIADADFDTYNSIGTALAETLKEQQQPSLIVASSDMSHYLPQEQAQAKDNLAIEAILNLDPEEFLNRVKKHKITVCGYGPIVCMLSAAKHLGARKAELIKYQTSADASGDYSSVVGYAGITVR